MANSGSNSKGRSKAEPVTILGVDPGTNIMGYAVLSSQGKRCALKTADVIRLGKLGDHYVRLNAIYQQLNQLLSEYRPTVLAIEAPFYGKNVQSMLKLGRAQGVAISVAISRGLAVHEYSPRKIKRAITGNGNASKEQVAKMLTDILGLTHEPATHDETDAIAAGMCYHYELCSPLQGAAQYKNWKDFLENNPQLIAGKKG